MGLRVVFAMWIDEVGFWVQSLYALLACPKKHALMPLSKHIGQMLAAHVGAKVY